GGPALFALLEPALGPVTMREVLERAVAGDQACRRVIADAGTAIGTAAANLCNLFNPERIVVGGDLGAAGDLLLQPLRDALARAAIPSAASDVDVVAGILGERAEVLGGIALVLRGHGAAGGGQHRGPDSAQGNSRREETSSLRWAGRQRAGPIGG